MTRQRIVIIGASSHIAEHCARLWAKQPADFVLVGRDTARVQRVADDLRELGERFLGLRILGDTIEENDVFIFGN